MMFTITSTFASANVSLFALATSLSSARSVVVGRPANCITKYKQIRFHAKVIHHVNVYCSDVRGENERMARWGLLGIQVHGTMERQLCSKILQSLGLMFTAFKVNEMFKVSKNLFSSRGWWYSALFFTNTFAKIVKALHAWSLKIFSSCSGQIDINTNILVRF